MNLKIVKISKTFGRKLTRNYQSWSLVTTLEAECSIEKPEELQGVSEKLEGVLETLVANDEIKLVEKIDSNK
jgi:hypothetical protein